MTTLRSAALAAWLATAGLGVLAATVLAMRPTSPDATVSAAKTAFRSPLLSVPIHDGLKITAYVVLGFTAQFEDAKDGETLPPPETLARHAVLAATRAFVEARGMAPEPADARILEVMLQTALDAAAGAPVARDVRIDRIQIMQRAASQ